MSESDYTELNIDEREELSQMFRLLGEPNRLGMVLACAEGELSVGDISKRLGLSQSLVSHHLRHLRDYRLLRSRRDGKQIFYSLADSHVRQMLMNMVEHVLHEDNCGHDHSHDHSHD